LPNPENISTSIVKDLKIAIAHVYVNWANDGIYASYINHISA
jgi:hypothetical protein